MTKEKLFEMFDTVAGVKTSIAIECIRNAKTVRDANWHATEMKGVLQGLCRGYTDVGEMFNICESLDDKFFEKMFYYRNSIDEELARFLAKRSKKK